MTTAPNDQRALIERSTELDELRFEQLDLRKLSLAAKTFSRCTWTKVSLQESDWRGALLEECVFIDCDLSRARLDGVRLRDVSFRRTRLMGVDWSGVGEFSEFDFDECDLQFATFVGVSLRKLQCKASRVTEATFERCDLTQANFTGSDLRASRFERCELGRADFSTASGALIDPTKNKAKGTKISAESAALLATSMGLIVTASRSSGR
ncbi:MAG: pentapeptide repeat-containing protein [Polyangiales bacterium]